MKEIIPIRFDGYMQSGGSTKPWRVIAIPADGTDLTEAAYVVKTFTSTQVRQAHNIGKEFICNALAAQFDLEVPEARMINLNNEDFIATLEEGPLNILASKIKGNTFASKLLVNASIINEEVKASSFDITDCATLFAFDCLVLNVDRGGHRNKPNLLVDDEGFFLIDHELTFFFIDSQNQDGYNRLMDSLNNNTWLYQHQKHLFYPRLKNYRGSKKNLFDTFEASLRNLDINHIRRIIDDLIDNDISIGQFDLLFTYLSTLKQNSAKFRSILSGLIS